MNSEDWLLVLSIGCCSLGKPNASKLQPVRVVLICADANRAAFKAQAQLRQQQLHVDDNLSKAQQNRRGQLWPILEHFKEVQPGLDPRFI